MLAQGVFCFENHFACVIGARARFLMRNGEAQLARLDDDVCDSLMAKPLRHRRSPNDVMTSRMEAATGCSNEYELLEP